MGIDLEPDLSFLSQKTRICTWWGCLLMLRLCHKGTTRQLLNHVLTPPFYPSYYDLHLLAAMVISLFSYNPRRPRVRRRRDATAVMAGRFDPLPDRDVLTSCLNHVGPYLEVEKNEEERRKPRYDKKERDRERKRKQRAEAKRRKLLMEAALHATTASTSSAGPSSQPRQPAAAGSSKCTSRPTIHIPAMQRPFSITPSPPSSPNFLSFWPNQERSPEPSVSSGTSRTSSKRPRTPADDEVMEMGSAQPSSEPRARKKRIAVKKGWKGWVEGSPEPSTKLINLDAVPILRERRTRSGKNFDAIGVGKDSWV